MIVDSAILLLMVVLMLLVLGVVWVCSCVYFPSVGFVSVRLLISCISMGIINILGLGFSLCDLLLDIIVGYCLNLTLSIYDDGKFFWI